MYFYGPNPFKWTWDVHNFKNELNIKHGEFCYYQGICSKLRLYISPLSMEFKNFTYQGVKFYYVEKNNIISNDLIPVLGDEIALPTDILATIPRTLVKNVFRNFKKINEKILKSKYEDLDFSQQKIRLRCLFHNDTNPSAVYYTETCYYKCYACNKVCKNLEKHLK